MAAKTNDREKVAKLMGVMADLQEKQNAVLIEINELLNGGVGIGEKLKELEGAFAELWFQEYQGGYVFNYVKDRPHLKRWLRTNTIEEIKGRMVRYFENKDPFYVKARHNFALFVSSFNNHAPLRPAGRGLERCVAEGKHDPPCQTEAQHTARYQDEMRAGPD